jgi:hypothetical protein
MVLILQFNEGSKASNGMSAHSGPVALGSNSNIVLRIFYKSK